MSKIKDTIESIEVVYIFSHDCQYNAIHIFRLFYSDSSKISIYLLKSLFMLNLNMARLDDSILFNFTVKK